MNLLHALYDGRSLNAVAFRTGDGALLTTGALRQAVATLASALTASGVAPGDRISFKLEKSLEVVVLAHASLHVGAILHPLNPSYTDEEIGALVEDAAPRLLVCEPKEAARLANVAMRAGIALVTLGSAGEGTLFAAASGGRDWSPPVAVSSNDTAAILYTSGTTGRPKGAQITHGNLAASARELAALWCLGSEDVLLHALPVYHAHGLLTSLNTLLVAGGSILFLPRFEAADVLDALPKATVMMGVPTHYSRLLREPGLDARRAAHCRLFISGSAPLPQVVALDFTKRTGHRIIERYGATETAIVTGLPPDAVDRAGWVGWPLPGVDIRVRKVDGSVAETAATGEIETRGHNVFAGYWRRPEEDAKAFTPDGWFATGDLAEIDESGCVRLLGRSKDLVISGGLNVYPLEVERVISAEPGIRESSVFGVPHPDFGEAVVAAIEIEPGIRFDEEGIVASMKRRLAPYKVPKRILVMETIPRNSMGKVLKKELRTHYQSLFATSRK